MAVRYALSLHCLPGRRARTRKRLEAERAAALAWCRERAVPTEELARRLPVPFTLTDVRARFPDAFREARARVAECPLEEFGGIRNHGAANLDLLYSLARAINARTVVETGVACGWSTLTLLLATADSGGGQGGRGAMSSASTSHTALTLPTGAGATGTSGLGWRCRTPRGSGGPCSGWRTGKGCRGRCGRRRPSTWRTTIRT